MCLNVVHPIGVNGATIERSSSQPKQSAIRRLRAGLAPSTFIGNTLGVAVTQVLLLVLNLLLVRVVLAWTGRDGLAEYIVAGRVIVVVYPLVTVGLETAVARAVALRADECRRLLGVALICASSVALMFIIFGYAARDAGGWFTYGAPEKGSLFFSAVVCAAGYALLMVWYGALRGSFRIWHGNVLQLAYLGLEFVSLLLALVGAEQFGDPIRSFLLLMGFGLISFVAVGSFVDGARPTWSMVMARELYGYGLPRIPSAFLLATVTAVPVFVASARVSLAAASWLGIAVVLIGAADTATMALTTTLFPKIATMTDPDRRSDLVGAMRASLAFAIHVAVLASITIPGLVSESLMLWLGPSFGGGLGVISLAAVGAGPYLAYAILRSVLNAVAARPWVTYLTMGSALAAVIGGYIGAGIGAIGLGISLVISLVVLGAGSIAAVALISRTWIRPADTRLVGFLLLAGAGLAGADLVANTLPLVPAVVYKIALRCALLTLVTVLVVHVRPSWWEETARRLQPAQDHGR